MWVGSVPPSLRSPSLGTHHLRSPSLGTHRLGVSNPCLPWVLREFLQLWTPIKLRAPRSGLLHCWIHCCHCWTPTVWAAVTKAVSSLHRWTPSLDTQRWTSLDTQRLGLSKRSGERVCQLVAPNGLIEGCGYVSGKLFPLCGLTGQGNASSVYFGISAEGRGDIDQRAYMGSERFSPLTHA